MASIFDKVTPVSARSWHLLAANVNQSQNAMQALCTYQQTKALKEMSDAQLDCWCIVDMHLAETMTDLFSMIKQASLFARMIEFCKAPVNQPQLPELVINHDLHRMHHVNPAPDCLQ